MRVWRLRRKWEAPRARDTAPPANSQGLGGGGSAGLEFFWEGWRQGATRRRHRSAAAWGLSLLSPPCGAGFVVLDPWAPPPAAKVCPGLERTTGMIGVSGCLALVA